MISYTLLLIASVVPLWQIIVVAVLAAAVVALGITDTVLLIKNKRQSSLRRLPSSKLPSSKLPSRFRSRRLRNSPCRSPCR